MSLEIDGKNELLNKKRKERNTQMLPMMKYILTLYCSDMSYNNKIITRVIIWTLH